MRFLAVPACLLGLSTVVAAQSFDSHHPWFRYAPGAHVTFRVTEDGVSTRETSRLESVNRKDVVLVQEAKRILELGLLGNPAEVWENEMKELLTKIAQKMGLPIAHFIAGLLGAAMRFGVADENAGKLIKKLS